MQGSVVKENQPETQEVVCSSCGAGDAELMWIARDIAFGGPGKFLVVRCRHCGLIYLRVRPTPQSMVRYYPPEYSPYRPAIQDESFFLMRWMRRRKVQKRRQIVERASDCVPGRILDVGCSTGIFLDAMRRSGWETYGVEINTTAAQYARQRFGLKVFVGQLTDAHLPSDSFDVMTFWDVLEHTFDPLESLHEANRLLIKGGVIGITLPNWDSLDRMIFGHEWIGYDVPRHLHVFTPLVLQKLLERTGFCLTGAWCDLGGYFTFAASARLWANVHVRMSWLRQAIVKAIGLHGVRFLFEPFFYLCDRLGRGGTLVVVARKVEASRRT